jgi:hypothetical protein
MTTTEFAKEDLIAIKRAFRTSKATPEEVRLLVRPLRIDVIRWALMASLAILSAGSMSMFYRSIQSSDEAVRSVVSPIWWNALLLIFGTFLMVFFILPRALSPMIEVVVRPGAKSVTLRGFGVEQEWPAHLCSAEVSKIRCSFKIDSDWYRIGRRFWQLGFSSSIPCDAINEAFAPARIAMFEAIRGGGGQRSVSPMLQRHNWHAIFSEAFVAETEMVFLLPSTGWQFYFGTVIPFGASFVAMAWDITHQPNFEKDLEVILAHIRSFPLWLPSVLVLLYTGLVGYLANPWNLRAVAIIPRGQGRIVIRVGKRVLGDFPILDSTFTVSSSQYDIFQPDIILGIHTPAWSGKEGTGLRTEDDLFAAIADLRAFAGVTEAPRITLDG